MQLFAPVFFLFFLASPVLCGLFFGGSSSEQMDNFYPNHRFYSGGYRGGAGMGRMRLSGSGMARMIES